MAAFSSIFSGLSNALSRTLNKASDHPDFSNAPIVPIDDISFFALVIISPFVLLYRIYSILNGDSRIKNRY